MSRPHSSQAGFTIVEMLIATTVFSLLLLGMTAAIIQISRMFYKGVITAQTQDVSRSVIDGISRPIQFSAETVTPVHMLTTASPSAPASGVVCVGSQRYTFAINAMVTDDPTPVYAVNHKVPHALWQDNRPADCTVGVNLNNPTPSAGGKELLNQNMRLTAFNVQELVAVPGMYEVHVGVIYGEDDLMTISDTNGDGLPDSFSCINGLVGSQWCSLSELNSFVTKRIKG